VAVGHINRVAALTGFLIRKYIGVSLIRRGTTVLEISARSNSDTVVLESLLRAQLWVLDISITVTLE